MELAAGRGLVLISADTSWTPADARDGAREPAVRRGATWPSERSGAPTSSVRSVDVTFLRRLEGVPSAQ